MLDFLSLIFIETFINGCVFMCIKMISKEDVIEINMVFDIGKIINEGSLDFALSSLKKTKDWLKQVSYLVRAVLIDHVFEEGNKRTATALIMSVFENQKIAYDPRKVDEVVIEIIIKNINNINKIRSLIKNATR